MTALILLLLAETWPVVYGDALLEQLHNYDILKVRVTVVPGAAGADIDCHLTVRVTRPGPLRFLLSRDVSGLTARLGDRPAAVELGAGGFAKIVRVVAPGIQGVPSLLTLRAPRALKIDEVVTFRLRYNWRPRDGWAYVGPDRIQTHLSSFWLPTMAHERFEAEVDLKVNGAAAGPGKNPVQVVCLTAGKNYTVHSRGRYEVLVPPGVDGQPVLDDVVAVMGKLEEWFGPAGPASFKVFIEEATRPSPSYCADSFAVVHRRALALDRARWISHLAHECSHLWWGHRVATPVIGRGGTWLREGLAQWSGIEVSGALLGPDARRKLWRANFRGYVRRLDLRRRDRLLFANEASLRDATYLDDPAVPYLRGALVLRRLEYALGGDGFRARLRKLADGFKFIDIEAIRSFAPDLVAYYADTTRLPDLELNDVKTGDGSAEGAVRGANGKVPVLIETESGRTFVTAKDGRFTWTGEGTPKRIEVDPERIHLDPVRSNNVWPR